MITGSLVALVTPFHLDSYKIDWNSLKRLIDWHVEQDTDGIVIAGTTGESSTLDVDEHSHIIDFVIKYVDGRVPVIAGTGANCTREAVALTRIAKEAGADAWVRWVMCVRRGRAKAPSGSGTGRGGRDADAAFGRLSLPNASYLWW